MENSLLDRLLEECDLFPSSTLESTMLYDYNKLMNILQKKEIFAMEGNQERIDRTHALSGRFNEIARRIVFDGPDEGVLGAYGALEQQVEMRLSGNMYVFAKQWGLSVKALYYYKAQNYDKAFDFSLECIILNEYLVREGLYTLLFRAAEQNKNISRIWFRRGDWEAGASLAKDLLRYLFNGEPGQLYGKIFQERQIWAEIPYVREGYAYECFKSIVSLMIHFEKRSKVETPELFDRMFGDLHFEVDTPDRQIIHNWIYIKSLFHAGGYGEFLAEFMEFMQEPKSRLYDILKIALYLDVVKLVQRSEYPKAGVLLEKLREQLDTNLNVHEYLKKDISARNLVYLESSVEKV